MAGKLKEYSNIRTFKKRNKQFNIGLLIFGVIFIYLIVTVFTYLTKNHVIRYEVREGSILKDNSYSGLVLREETIIPAAAGGYLNYYAAEGSKVAVGFQKKRFLMMRILYSQKKLFWIRKIQHSFLCKHRIL